jgi:hypothetical protein
MEKKQEQEKTYKATQHSDRKIVVQPDGEKKQDKAAVKKAKA